VTDRVVIPYKPRPWQQRWHDEAKRFNVNVWHRRAGKTVAVVNHLLREACICPLDRPRVGYIAPLYRQAKRIAWDYVREFARVIPGVEFKESELTAVLPNGGRFSLYGADNPDSLRGLYFDYVGLDEVAQMSPRVWSEVVRPALADRQGGAVFIGTPMGKLNQFHDLLVYARDGGDPDWRAEVLTVDDTTALRDEELQAARGTMQQFEFEQEFYCSFTANVRGSFYGHLMEKAEREGRVGRFPYEATLPVVTAWDIGLRDATVVTYWQHPPEGPVCIACDAFTNTALTDIYSHIRTNRPWNYVEHIGPHDLGVRNPDEHGLTTRRQTAALHGYDFTIAPRRPREDGIEATRHLLARARFNEDTTVELREALALYRAEYDDRRRVFGLTPVHDWTSDFADSVRYFAVTTASRMKPIESWRENDDDLAAAQRRLNFARIA
jgi:hypothetical protein